MCAAHKEFEEKYVTSLMTRNETPRGNYEQASDEKT